MTSSDGESSMERGGRGAGQRGGSGGSGVSGQRGGSTRSGLRGHGSGPGRGRVAPPKTRGKKRRRTVFINGWVPDEHGSWAMGFLPLIAGLVINPRTWLTLVLALAWTAGFFLFAVAHKWLKFRFKPRYRPALYTYLALTSIATVILLAANPTLLWWAPVFLPLIAVSAHRAWARRERELTSRVVAIVASCLMVPVTASVTSTTPWFTPPLPAHSWLMAGLIALYFITTVPYVKTLIRERKSLGWLVGSVLVHALALAVVIILAVSQMVGWAHVVVWFVVLVRAVVMPLAARRRGKPWRPAVVGIGEIILTLLVALTLPW
ncbi:MAG: YwiC-like family protein [Actinomycetaceae bacterium]|nr:YwiC-like family protein [Actinomycetaceae bacterium]